MPTPEILDGREHFQAITGSGQGGIAGTVVPGQTPGQLECNLTTWNLGLKVLYKLKASKFLVPASRRFNCRTFEPLYQLLARLKFENSNSDHDSPNPGYWNNSYCVRRNFTRFNNGFILTQSKLMAKFLLTNILAIAQSTFPNGLWWIKDRNSNAHQS